MFSVALGWFDTADSSYCCHCSVLGQGVLGALQSSAAAGLLSPNALLVPEHVTIHGQLINSRLSQRVSGFDLSPVNKYKWHPTIEQVDHSRWVADCVMYLFLGDLVCQCPMLQANSCRCLTVSS